MNDGIEFIDLKNSNTLDDFEEKYNIENQSLLDSLTALAEKADQAGISLGHMYQFASRFADMDQFGRINKSQSEVQAEDKEILKDCINVLKISTKELKKGDPKLDDIYVDIGLFILLCLMLVLFIILFLRE